MDYPRMLYPDGDPAQDYLIVANEAEEKTAAKKGFCQAYSKRVKEKTAGPDAQADAATADAADADAPKAQ